MEANHVYLEKSTVSFAKTLKHLEDEVKKRGIRLFAEFDHRQNAEEVGLTMRNAVVLVFGSPQAGTKLMIENPAIALELPLKIAIWEDDQNQVWISYKDVESIADAYDLHHHPIIQTMKELLHDIVHDVIETKAILEDGTVVYFLISGYVMKGKVIDLHKTNDTYTFSIEGYGGCGGNHILSGDQLHHRIFLSKEEAEQYQDVEQMYLEGHCS